MSVYMHLKIQCFSLMSTFLATKCIFTTLKNTQMKALLKSHELYFVILCAVVRDINESYYVDLISLQNDLKEIYKHLQ